MTEQITMQALTWKGIAAVIGIILPIVVLIVWKMKQGKIRLKPAVAGAVVFIIFAQMLETVPKLFLFGDTKISEYVWSHPWAYVTAGCLLAGIFEEIGRYVAFRFFLKDYHDRKDAITYGIGHGGIPFCRGKEGKLSVYRCFVTCSIRCSGSIIPVWSAPDFSGRKQISIIFQMIDDKSKWSESSL